PRREAGHARGGDLDLLAGARVATLACAAVGDVELPEAGEGHFAAALQRVLDRLEDRVDGIAGILLAEPAVRGNLVDELGFRHVFLLRGVRGMAEANNPRGREQREFPASTGNLTFPADRSGASRAPARLS